MTFSSCLVVLFFQRSICQESEVSFCAYGLFTSWFRPGQRAPGMKSLQRAVLRPCAQGNHHLGLLLAKPHGQCPGDPPTGPHFLEKIVLVRFQHPHDWQLQKSHMQKSHMLSV